MPTTKPVALDNSPKIIDCQNGTFDPNSPARRSIRRGNVADLRLKFDGFSKIDNKRDPKRLERSCPKPITPVRSTKKAKERNAKKVGFDPKQSLILHYLKGQGGQEGGTGAS